MQERFREVQTEVEYYFEEIANLITWCAAWRVCEGSAPTTDPPYVRYRYQLCATGFSQLKTEIRRRRRAAQARKTLIAAFEAKLDEMWEGKVAGTLFVAEQRVLTVFRGERAAGKI